MSEPPERPPARTRICIACRTTFGPGETCPGGRVHETVSLQDPRGRARLDDEVWGPDSRARKARQAARAGAGGAGIGSVLEGCGGCDAGGLDGCGELGSEAAIVVLGILLVAGVAIVLFWFVRWLVRAIREKLERPKPHGALRAAPRPKARVVAASGVVRDGTPLALPWAAGSAFAYAMELYEARPFGGGAMLREAVSARLDIALDDGRVLRIPAGRIRVLGSLPQVEGERARIEGRLGLLDPGRGPDQASLFPFDHVRGLTLGPGTRVEVLGEVTQSPEGSEGGYRAGAGVLVPVGVPVLRVVSGTRIATAATPAMPAGELEGDEEIEAEEPEPAARRPRRA